MKTLEIRQNFVGLFIQRRLLFTRDSDFAEGIKQNLTIDSDSADRCVFSDTCMKFKRNSC